ncbi:hypothetical protein EDC04DRAFT_2627683 [Pisolithus marmoratus]|nr:hypothetical protein EDC04DRAFT_2627683 [Pisolithus marmoratus]
MHVSYRSSSTTWVHPFPSLLTPFHLIFNGYCAGPNSGPLLQRFVFLLHLLFSFCLAFVLSSLTSKGWPWHIE